jgi:5-formyltetrahydrofolate cyclo-ligase
MTKQEIRTQIKEKLLQNKQQLNFWSHKICKNIINSDFYKSSKTVYAYMSLSDEVNLCEVIDDAILKNKTVYIPKIIPGTSKMIFYDYSKCSVKKGSFDIMEPQVQIVTENFENTIINHNEEQVLFLIPGRFFSFDGKRVGRGKGFYDYYLQEFLKVNKKNVLLAGVCFPIQIGKQVPAAEHDIQMNTLFTCSE